MISRLLWQKQKKSLQEHLFGAKVKKKLPKRVTGRDFPGGAVVKNLPSNAGDAGSIPGQGTKIRHAAGQLSLCAATREAHVLQ